MNHSIATRLFLTLCFIFFLSASQPDGSLYYISGSGTQDTHQLFSMQPQSCQSSPIGPTHANGLPNQPSVSAIDWNRRIMFFLSADYSKNPPVSYISGLSLDTGNAVVNFLCDFVTPYGIELDPDTKNLLIWGMNFADPVAYQYIYSVNPLSSTQRQLVTKLVPKEDIVGTMLGLTVYDHINKIFIFSVNGRGNSSRLIGWNMGTKKMQFDTTTWSQNDPTVMTEWFVVVAMDDTKNNTAIGITQMQTVKTFPKQTYFLKTLDTLTGRTTVVSELTASVSDPRGYAVDGKNHILKSCSGFGSTEELVELDIRTGAETGSWKCNGDCAQTLIGS